MWEKAEAKSHPGAWTDGFCDELPAGIPVPFTLWDSDATTILARRGASAIKSAILIGAISRMAANNKCLAESNKSPDGPVATKKRAANR